MIDIHQHVLYGLDDGSESFDMTKELLLSSREQGVHTIVATAHALKGRSDFDLALYRERFSSVQAWLDTENIAIRLLSGCEILYSPSAVRMLDEGKILTMNGTRFALVEFFPDTGYHEIMKAMREFINGGYRPIIAHVERYADLRTKKLERIEELRQMGVKFQINGSAALRASGLFGDSFVKKLLKEGIPDYVGSDAHGWGTRKVNLKSAYEALVKLVGPGYAGALTEGNTYNDILRGNEK